MKRTKIIRCITTALLFATSIQASHANPSKDSEDVKIWSLQECIDYANAHNLEMQMQQVDIKKQEISLNTSKNKRLPNLTASATQSFSFGRSASGYDNTYQDRNSSSTQWSASTSVPIFTGFLINNEIAASKLDLQAVTAEFEAAKENMEINITTLYLQVLYNKEMLAIANDQVTLSREQLERVEKLHENGRASDAQIYEVKAQIANDELSVVQTASDLQLAILSLTQLLELPSPEGFDVEEPGDMTDFSLVRKPDAIYETALTTRSIVRSNELRLKSAERFVKIARSAYFPTLSFGAGYGNNYYRINDFDNLSFSDQLKNNRNEYFGFNLSIPIFNRFSTRNQVKTARLNMHLQKLQLENTKKTLYKEIQQAYYNALTAGEQFKSAETAFLSAEKSFGYMTEKLDNQRATMYEYNESKTGMTKARSNRTQAKYNFILRKKILEFYERPSNKK